MLPETIVNFAPKILTYAERMSKPVKVKKGIDIKLEGPALQKTSDSNASSVYALKPDDYFGMIPKLTVREGDEVEAGSPLFFDKQRENILFVSPVSGEVIEVKRGDKRKILEVKVLADKEIRYKSFKAWDKGQQDRDALVKLMLEMGLWPFVKQRPYGVIASPKDTPRDIFISAHDSAPLAADVPYTVGEEKAHFQAGIDALNLLTSGQVHLGVKKGDTFFKYVSGIEHHEVSGPHPAGNVGVLIHHIAPINKGETVWTVNALDVLLIGRCLSKGKYDASRTIALVGSEVSEPQYYRTRIGALIESITSGKIKNGKVRYISGNVLTGSKESAEGFLGAYSNCISVIPEGDEKKFFISEGWLAPGLNKFSLSKAYPTWLFPNKTYRLDTNLNGEKRAFVVTGELEKVFPFDIYPMQLIKAIMINDIESMENLGIYEVEAEDFALCEFVCTSKINIQDVVKQGLADMRKEFAS
jgi:Na+-transporting NADH:ubiquinone oxidoreductase subunit A